MFDKKIICPKCKDTYTHIARTTAEYIFGKDHYEAWEGRGDCIKIEMYCESYDHKFNVVMGEHKGNTFIFTELLKVSESMEFLIEE